MSKAKSSRSRLSKHDKEVKNTAAYYESRGYRVRADLPGAKQRPGMIEGRRPDVVASKKGDTVIIEVETKSSIKKDSSQQNTFKKHAKVNKNIRFRVKKVK